MNNEEFAFVNQQLAGMLKSGIPLEGALRQLCASMKRGPLRDELQRLETDLAAGKPLVNALAERRLPPLYQRMLAVGVAANDLPGVLTLLADHYQRLHLTTTRLKGLMIYPLLVLLAGLGLSIFLSVMVSGLVRSAFEPFSRWNSLPAGMPLTLWVLPTGLLGIIVLAGVFWSIPRLRRDLRWQLPGFKEASLAQLAAGAGMMLERGVPLPESLALLESIEQRSNAGAELAGWRRRISEGRSRFTEIAGEGRVFPNLFVWLVASGGEDLAAGFKQAAGIYQARANYRSEMILYGALPVAILFLGFLIVGQLWPVLGIVASFMDRLGG